MTIGIGLHGGWKFSQSMSLDSAVLGGAVTKPQVWVDGWRAQFAAEAIVIHSAHESLSEGISATHTGGD